ncbi:MAG: 2-oxo acid dehydrogenase subunit E2 [Solirubrobacterales bacterium]
MIGVRLPEEAWEDVEEGVEGLLEEWLVEEGAAVEAGQGLANATVVKTSFEVLAPTAGTLKEIAVAGGETFGREADLAWIEPVEGAAAPSAGPEPAKAPPVADSAAGEAEGTAAERIPFTGIRGAVARNMATAWQNPRVAAGARVEMSACLALEEELRASLDPGLKLSPTHLLLRAVALTLAEHPRLNGVVGEGAAEIAPEVAIGLAVSLEEGIVVPVIRDVASRALSEIISETSRLTKAARAGELGNAELSGGTFTVSNLGATGIDWFTPILNSPQIAILGVGAIAERPVARAGQVSAAPTMDLTLVYDHRAVDGHPASLMLAALRDRLQRADLGLDG